MYPKNNATPPPYDVGCLIQISDGAIQTSGESARVKIGTGAWGAAAGTPACDATSGIYTYIPSQAETNAESFVVAIYKAGCVSISRTVITSASSTAGRTMPADGSITAAVIATDAIDADSLKSDAVTEIQSGLSTLTQTQITGGAYAINHASFAFNAGLDFTTTQKAATLARVTLVDTLTTYTGNTVQTGDSFARIGATGSGLTSLAPAATALSTATWTGTLATNIGTTNTTVASNLDATVSSRLATASYTAPPSAGTISTQVASDLAAAHGAGSWATATGFSTLSQADIRTAIGLATANLDTQIGLLATAANLLVVSDGVGFITAVLMGACSDAGTAGETYVVTFGGATYTTDFTGLDATGNRTTTTRTKT